MVPVAIPNNPVLVGAQLVFQTASTDPSVTNHLPYFTTNALRVVVQP
jgi:hypothetical protein